ncbi:MAG: ATPase domain-containing protein, partial [Candidatus Dojkabacteria bacterium]|nr:ATPase domain-containing protein [Candidatus Dojkabacteria bacterium]
MAGTGRSGKSSKSVYVCVSCGYETVKWAGKCPECGTWGSLEQQIREELPAGRTRAGKPAVVTVLEKADRPKALPRLSLGMNELDRVLGGGLVGGEVVLLAGEPGIGKSTLLLQVAMDLSLRIPVLYVSGEESLSQIGSRFERLSGPRTDGKATKRDTLLFTEETDVDRITAALVEQKPGVVIVDSVQSLSTADVTSFPGSITQVRESGTRLTQAAKSQGIPVIIVGQVTKEGAIAGPKVLEHVVDAVVHFEGDDRGVHRILRCSKNRFGTTDEVGVFEMTGQGLVEVDDPGDLFGSQQELTPGSAMCAVVKGSRTFFVEIQALTAPAVFGSPRRLPTGIARQRLEMLCAVLSRRAKVDVSSDDVYVSVIG